MKISGSNTPRKHSPRRSGRAFKTIIVGVDLSHYSKIVVREAKELGREMNSPVKFIYVYEEDLGRAANNLKLDRAKISRACQNEAKDLYGDDVEVQVRFGRADHEIITAARKSPDPLIVVGHRGGGTISRFLLGSVAESLAENSPCPVWFHRGSKVVQPRKILLPSELDKRSEHTLRALEPLRNVFHADVEVYHVLPQPTPLLESSASWSSIENILRGADDDLVARFRKKHPGTNVVRERGPVLRMIQNHAGDFDVVALSRGNAKQRAGFGRVAKKLIRSGTKPLLCFPS